MPRKRAESYFNLRRCTVMDRCGYFPAVEGPETLALDMTAFFTEITSA